MDDPYPILGVAALLMLAPFVIVSITAFVKIAVVLFLVRSALGIQQTPPNLVLYGVTVILTAYVSAPMFGASYAAIQALDVDLADPEVWPLAYEAGVGPIRDFLMRFTTPEDRAFFVNAAQELSPDAPPAAPEDLIVLAPAFVTAELTRAFEIGVLLYLPFIVIDLVVTNILTAMGMLMVSPLVISLPFKLLLFVAVDGWTRLTHGLVISYAAGG